MSLHLETVSEALIALLHRLMDADELEDFYLVGGTALALRFGHRTSIDIDLFTHQPFDAKNLSEVLMRNFGLREAVVEQNTVLGQINSIKTDFIADQYPLIGKIEIVEGIRLLSIEDSAAMKLNAIANRGSKKDFWDYALLLNHFDREDLLSFFEQKYPDASRWNLEKSLCYFDDAEGEPDPVDLTGATWPEIKSLIQQSNRLL
jgi:predicted nucleotidyltransferase component of viral defense system